MSIGSSIWAFHCWPYVHISSGCGWNWRNLCILAVRPDFHDKIERVLPLRLYNQSSPKCAWIFRSLVVVVTCSESNTVCLNLNESFCVVRVSRDLQDVVEVAGVFQNVSELSRLPRWPLRAAGNQLHHTYPTQISNAHQLQRGWRSDTRSKRWTV